MTVKPLAFVVEDDPNLNEITCLALEPYFTIESYQYGDLAYQRLDEICPTLVVLDINLPKISGADILKKLRSDARFSETRVILTTADNINAGVLDSQADIVLLKPVSPNQLRELAVRLLPTIS